MGRRLPPPAGDGRAGGFEATGMPARCPRCGAGDLFPLAVRRRRGDVRLAAYCAGVYDRERRRFLRRGCGYWEGNDAVARPAAGPLRLEPEERAGPAPAAQPIGGRAAHAIEPAS